MISKFRSRTRVALAMLLVLAGCASKPEPPKPVGLKLYVFDCGSIEVLDISLFHPGYGEGEHKTLVDSCYLVIHPKGSLLWDTGLPDTLVNQPDGVNFMGKFQLRVKRPLMAQLQEIGVSPEMVRYLGISHMHNDHLGNAALFHRATLLIQRAEYDAAFGPSPEKFGFDAQSYASLRSNPVRKLEGDYDVFGDGKVVIRRTPGHTPGHQSLFLRLPETGNVLLSGDLVHFTENWEKHGVPGFNFSKEKSLQTMSDTAAFLKANNAQLWIQHDAEQNATLRHAPAFYQ